MYDYEAQRAFVFTDDGQRGFLKIRDHVNSTLNKSGAITLWAAISAGVTGCSWELMACVDRLVELGELREVIQSGVVMGQNRIFIKNNL